MTASCSSSAGRAACWVSGRCRNPAAGCCRCPNSPTTSSSGDGALVRTRWAPGAAALAGAARVVEAVVADGRSADAALVKVESGTDRPAVRAIALGTVRWYLRLAPAIDALMKRPAGVASAVRALLAVGAHQIEYSRNVPEQTVHAAVDAARIL